MPTWKRWAAAVVSEFFALALLLSIFMGWRIAIPAIAAVMAVLVASDIFLLKLKPSGKEPLGAYMFPLVQALLLSTVVAVLVGLLFYKVVAAG